MPELAVVTVVHGRLEHLANQERALRAQPTDYERVVVQMGGPSVSSTVGPAATVLDVGGEPGHLPLAAARNAGAAASTAATIVFLDVDCIPSPSMLARYRNAAATTDGLLAGPVAYLPAGATALGTDPQRLATLAEPHAARPAPPDGAVVREHRYELFWSLSFAVGRGDWERLGGFCEAYVGYGGEDTDLAYTARAAGMSFSWVGGALAWHQHHEVEDPPVRHLAAIVVNSRLFRARWGVWPMTGWLEAFARAGLVRWDPEGDLLELPG